MDEKINALVAEWMRKADHDRGMAKLALDARSPFTDGVCFHAQQAAEKDLKACLVAMDIQFEKSHDHIDEPDDVPICESIVKYLRDKPDHRGSLGL